MLWMLVASAMAGAVRVEVDGPDEEIVIHLDDAAPGAWYSTTFVEKRGLVTAAVQASPGEAGVSVNMRFTLQPRGKKKGEYGEERVLSYSTLVVENGETGFHESGQKGRPETWRKVSAFVDSF